MREPPSLSDSDTTRWLPAGPTYKFHALTDQINAITSLEHKLDALTEKIAESSYINEKFNALTSFEHKFVALTEKIVTFFEYKLAENHPTFRAFEHTELQLTALIEKIGSFDLKFDALTEKLAETNSTIHALEQKTTGDQFRFKTVAY